MPKKPRSPKTRPASRSTARKPKSSLAARRLIRAALRGRSLREAARVLRLPNHGQLQKMLNGDIGDTPAMKAALARADARAKRAYFLFRADDQPLTAADLAPLVADLEKQLAALKALLPK